MNEDLTKFNSAGPEDVDRAVRQLAERVATLEACVEGLTECVDELAGGFRAIAEQHGTLSKVVTVLTRLHPPPPSNDAFARDPHAWGEVGIKEKL